jgi:hypothetical protein
MITPMLQPSYNCLSPHSLRGRLRYADWLRRPLWRNG